VKCSAGHPLPLNLLIEDDLLKTEMSLSSLIKDDLGLSSFAEDAWIGFNMYGRLIQGKIVLPFMAGLISK
jgi:hypothetical protein